MNTATPGPLHTYMLGDKKIVRQNYLDTIAKLLCEARIVYYRASDFQKLFISSSALSYERITIHKTLYVGIILYTHHKEEYFQ